VVTPRDSGAMKEIDQDAAAGARRDAAWSCVGTTKTGAVSRAGRMGRLRVQMYTYIYTVDAGTVARVIKEIIRRTLQTTVFCFHARMMARQRRDGADAPPRADMY
jgi:hypothetical protein